MFDGALRYLKADYGIKVLKRLPISSDYTGSTLASLGVLAASKTAQYTTQHRCVTLEKCPSTRVTRRCMMVERVVLMPVMPQGDCAAIVEIHKPVYPPDNAQSC
jgi:hypothetical protein